MTTFLDGTEVGPIDRARAERCQVVIAPGAVPRLMRIDHARSVWPVAGVDDRSDDLLEAMWCDRFAVRRHVALIAWVCHHDGIETSLWRTNPRRGGRPYVVLTDELVSTDTVDMVFGARP